MAPKTKGKRKASQPSKGNGSAKKSKVTTKKAKVPANKKTTTTEVGTPSKTIDYMGLELDSEEGRKWWAKLVAPKRDVQCTKFIDMGCLKDLGLDIVMTSLFDKVGMKDFLFKKAETYVRYTYEFLATLKKGKGEISFNLNDEEYSMTYEEIREAFGWTDPPADNEWTPLGYSDCLLFWRAITDTNFNSRGDYSFSIPHPCLRLAHRFLTTTVLCQGGATKITRLGMSYLWAMTPEGKGVPDWVELFLDNCLQVREASSGQISMGGMITLLAEHKKIEVPKNLNSLGDKYLIYDVANLSKVGMLSKSKIGYFWCYGPKGSNYLRLPRPKGLELPYGSNASDFFVPLDSDVAPHLGKAGVVESQEKVDEELNANVDDDWDLWRAPVDDRLEILYDGQREILAYSRCMNRFLAARYPGLYEPPDDAFMNDLAFRAQQRAERQAARDDLESSDSGDSSTS